MPAFVYILQNPSGRHYIGSTVDLDGRYRGHERGNTRSTRRRGPWRVVYVEQCKDLKEARQREREIKRYKGGIQFKALLQRAAPA
ncbi:MAG: GIY-YIG nuclease family protein [Candidatus Acidiferrales bacterium]